MVLTGAGAARGAAAAKLARPSINLKDCIIAARVKTASPVARRRIIYLRTQRILVKIR
jgi:hypothetical protein